MLLKTIEQIVFYLLLFLLPIQIGKHFWPWFTQVLGIRVDYLSPVLYGTDLLIIFLAGIVLFTNRRHMLSSGRAAFSHFFIQGLGMLIVSCSIGVIVSPIPPEGLYGLIKIIECVFFGWYVVSVVKTETEFQRIVGILFLSASLQSLLAIMQFLHQGSIGGLLYWIGERSFTLQTPGIARATIQGALLLRPYGTFPHPNVLAGFLIIIMIYALSMINAFKNKWLVIGGLILCSFALFLTLSRLPILLWVCIIVFYGGVGLRHQKRFEQWMIILGGIVLFSIFYILPTGERLIRSSLSEESVVVREQLALSSLGMIRDHPFFGVGLRNFLIALPGYNPPHMITFSLQPVHSIYLYWFAETGIFGLFFGLIFLINTFFHGVQWAKFKASSQNVFVAFIVVLILGSFDHYFLTLQQGQLLFALVIGLVWAVPFSLPRRT